MYRILATDILDLSLRNIEIKQYTTKYHEHVQCSSQRSAPKSFHENLRVVYFRANTSRERWIAFDSKSNLDQSSRHIAGTATVEESDDRGNRPTEATAHIRVTWLFERNTQRWNLRGLPIERQLHSDNKRKEQWHTFVSAELCVLNINNSQGLARHSTNDYIILH